MDPKVQRAKGPKGGPNAQHVPPNYQNSPAHRARGVTPGKHGEKLGRHGDVGKHISIAPSSLRNGMEFSMQYHDVPLLSLMIAHLAPFFDFNYYLAGTLLIPVLASLFILPLGVYFFRIGVPVSGLLGGLIGTFAGGYYMRSSIGRIDTDMLNLFFPVISSLLILLASQAKSERSVLLYSVDILHKNHQPNHQYEDKIAYCEHILRG